MPSAYAPPVALVCGWLETLRAALRMVSLVASAPQIHFMYMHLNFK